MAVFVEDVSRADAPSVVVASREYPQAQFADDGELPFAVDVPVDTIEEGHRYTVRVHVDVDGSYDVSLGDFVSTQHHGVLTDGGELQLRVPVSRV